MKNADLFQLTQFAEAAYADFTVSSDQQQAALQEKKLSKTQATALLSQWSIASHQPNTSSGFSATLFKNKDNSYVLAMRGTEQKTIDLAIVDGMDIVRDGLAMDQIVDMYNYWQQLKASQGASYQVAELETLVYGNHAILGCQGRAIFEPRADHLLPIEEIVREARYAEFARVPEVPVSIVLRRWVPHLGKKHKRVYLQSSLPPEQRLYTPDTSGTDPEETRDRFMINH